MRVCAIPFEANRAKAEVQLRILISMIYWMAINKDSLDKIDRMLRIIEIGLFIGKNLNLIIGFFMGISFVLAIYNALISNIVGSLISLAFGMSGLLFFAQVRQTRARHRERRRSYQGARIRREPVGEGNDETLPHHRREEAA